LVTIAVERINKFLYPSRRRHTRFHVTGVQTCALPIFGEGGAPGLPLSVPDDDGVGVGQAGRFHLGGLLVGVPIIQTELAALLRKTGRASGRVSVQAEHDASTLSYGCRMMPASARRQCG